MLRSPWAGLGRWAGLVPPVHLGAVPAGAMNCISGTPGTQFRATTLSPRVSGRVSESPKPVAWGVGCTPPSRHSRSGGQHPGQQRQRTPSYEPPAVLPQQHPQPPAAAAVGHNAPYPGPVPSRNGSPRLVGSATPQPGPHRMSSSSVQAPITGGGPPGFPAGGLPSAAVQAMHGTVPGKAGPHRGDGGASASASTMGSSHGSEGMMPTLSWSGAPPVNASGRAPQRHSGAQPAPQRYSNGAAGMGRPRYPSYSPQVGGSRDLRSGTTAQVSPGRPSKTGSSIEAIARESPEALSRHSGAIPLHLPEADAVSIPTECSEKSAQGTAAPGPVDAQGRALLEQYDRQIAKLGLDLQNCKDALQSQRAQCAEKEQELATMAGMLQQQEQAHGEAQARQQEAQARQQEAQARQQEAQARTQEEEAMHEQARVALAEAQARLGEEARAHERTKAMLTEARMELERSTAVSDELLRKEVANGADAVQEGRALKIRYANLEKQMDARTAEVLELKRRLEELQQQRREVELKHSEARHGEVSELRRRLEDQQQRREAEAKLSEARAAEVVELKRRLEGHQSQRREVEAKFNEMRALYQDLQEKHSALADQKASDMQEFAASLAKREEALEEQADRVLRCNAAEKENKNFRQRMQEQKVVIWEIKKELRREKNVGNLLTPGEFLKMARQVEREHPFALKHAELMSHVQNLEVDTTFLRKEIAVLRHYVPPATREKLQRDLLAAGVVGSAASQPAQEPSP